jgi:hypothetical protein
MMSRGFWRKLRRAVAEDGISYFVPGLSTVRVLLGRFGLSRLGERSFLRLKLLQLQAAYKNEVSWMELPFGNDVRTVPLLAAALWTAHTNQAARVQVTLRDDQFKLNNEIQGLTEPALQAYLAFLKQRDRPEPRPDLNLRIANWHEVENNTEITVQPVSYFDHIRTNLTMDYVHEAGGYCLRESVHTDGRLEPIGRTSLADHLGIDTLLFSVDGHLIVSRRSRRLAVTVGKLGCVGAGALKLSDFPKYRRRVALPKLNLLRELFEETTLTESDIDLDSLHILGVGRDLLRGGKPQLFLSVRSLLTADRILRKWESAETYYEHKKLIAIPLGKPALNDHMSKEDLLELRVTISDFVTRHFGKMTEPLLGALAIWWCERQKACGSEAPCS